MDEFAELGRTTAARRIAVALRDGRHHVIGCTGPVVILATTAALYATPATHYLDDGQAVTVATGPLTDDLRERLRQGGIPWSITLAPVASVTTARLAALLGCTTVPDSSPAVFHRRPVSRPDRAPPLLRAAQQRLEAYQHSIRPQPGRTRP